MFRSSVKRHELILANNGKHNESDLLGSQNKRLMWWDGLYKVERDTEKSLPKPVSNVMFLKQGDHSDKGKRRTEYR